MTLQPLTLREAYAFVRQHHRRHAPPQGAMFAIGLSEAGQVVGCAIVGRPVARGNQDGWTAEVTRLCTDGTKNAASTLYGAAWRACRAMGYRRLVTYTWATEPGTSLRAAGWRELYTTRARAKGWDTPSRPRVQVAQEAKRLWEVAS